MSGIYTTQQFESVGIYIAPTIDLSMTLGLSEKGIVGAIGEVSYGYPFKPIILKENSLEIKSTLAKYGGSLKNEFAYHVSDGFNSGVGKLVIGRILGDLSKTAYVSLNKNNVLEDATFYDYALFIQNKKNTSVPYQISISYVGATKELTVEAVATDGTVLWNEVGKTDKRLSDYINSDDDKYIDVDSYSEAFVTGAGDFSLISPIFEANEPLITTTSSSITLTDYNGVRFFDETATLTAGAYPFQIGVSFNDGYMDNEALKLVVKYSAVEDDYLTITLKNKDDEVLYFVEGSTLVADVNYIGDKIDTNFIQLDADFTNSIFDDPFEIVDVVSGAYMQSYKGNIYESSLSPIDIFGGNGINEWEDLPLDVGEHFQYLIKQCFEFVHSVKMTYKAQKRELEVILFDNHNREIYRIKGSIDVESKDDYGIPNYLPLLLDSTIMDMKIDSTNENFEKDFVYIDTLQPYTINDGIPQYDLAVEVMGKEAEKMDYFMSAGLYDISVLQKIWSGVLFKAKTPMIIDVPYFEGNLKSAEKWVRALNLNHEYVVKIWNNTKSQFVNGIQAIGLSGWYAGESITKNLSEMVGDVESRIHYSIAGVDYPPPRNYIDVPPDFDQDELENIVDLRINTLRVINDKICIGDALSSYPKWTPLRLFANAEAKAFLERYIARIIASKFFKNNNEALRFVRDKVRILFLDLDEVNTFNKEEKERYAFKVTLSDDDLITVEYDCILAGVLRRGKIQGTVSRKIELKR